MSLLNNENIKFEKEQIRNFIEVQKLLKQNILKSIDKIIIVDISKNLNASSVIIDIHNSLSKITENICLLSNLQALLEEMSNSFSQELLENYNKKYEYAFTIINSNNIYIHNSLLAFLDLTTINSPSLQNENVNSNNSLEEENHDNTENSENNLTLKENVLLISEKNNNVILPYKISELERILEKDDKYNSIEDIIKDKYTISLSNYKHSSISRFKEAFKLVKKSNGSTQDALDLGIEVLFKYDLNPAIITACKNIDEFDIYLSCLEDNVLNEFNYFNIEYEALPTIKKT